MPLPNRNQVIVLDTNVLLNVYRYSPEFSNFALECIGAISQHIVLPSTVRIEYFHHNKAVFNDMKKRFEEIGKETEKQIISAKNKIIDSCANLIRLQYPDVEDLKTTLGEKLDDVQKVLDDYLGDHSSLELIQNSWHETDHLEEMVRSMIPMQSLTQEDIYKWCDEGKKRYKGRIPPGFMDEKNKDGVRKYSDFIIWKEVMIYAKKHKKDIMFVTDDVKSDWWDETGFHTKLLREFETKTEQSITPMKSMEFLALVAEEYNIEKSDAVEIALQMTDIEYCKKIKERVFNESSWRLVYDATDYIKIENSTIGSEGIDEFEIIDHKFLKAERVERDNSKVVYEFTYNVTLEGTSFEYWGRDEDTKEVIRSNGRDHVFEGDVTVEVQRDVEIFYDFEDDDNFETAVIIRGNLLEIEAADRQEPPGEMGYCPACGKPLDIYNDAGTGFCVACSQDND